MKSPRDFFWMKRRLNEAIWLIKGKAKCVQSSSQRKEIDCRSIVCEWNEAKNFEIRFIRGKMENYLRATLN